MFNNFPKRTGIYHIKDGIEHLELKVTFRHINSLLRLPKFDYNKIIKTEWKGNQSKKEVEEKAQRNALSNNIFVATNDETETKEVCIKWKEKLFSASEEVLYKESKNCITDIQKKYHNWLMERVEAEAELEDPDESKSKRRRKRRQKKIQKNVECIKKQKQIQEIHTYIDEDHFQPKDVENSPISEDAEHMYIYATIDVDTQLVHLKWVPKENMLHIYPDFNSFDYNPYFIEIDKDYRHLYAFAVENISKSRSTLPGGNLSLYLALPELKPHWRSEEERRAIFAMPPKRTKRISMLLELGEACNFEHDNVHVRYHIHLPPNTIHEEGLLEASTHSSSMSDSGIHHFGHNWQLTLLCEEDYDAADFLHIYFEVISIDSWGRERMEGYVYFAVNLLKTSNAVEQHRLQCLRPVDSFFSSLERFFIGGRRKFDFVRFFGQEQITIDTDVGTDFHCRYGCRMKNTGTLELSCQIFTQRNCELLEPCANRKSGMTLDDIMQAYHEARKRLEALALQ